MDEPPRTPADAQAEYDAQIKLWAKQSYREEIERARQMTGEEKIRESLQLYLRTRSIMLAGIRDQFPGVSEEDVEEKYVERLNLNRRLEGM